MRIFKLQFLTLLFIGVLASCSKDNNDSPPQGTTPPDTSGVSARDLTVERFVYRGLNEIYLYKADVPVLANNYFATNDDRDNFLDNYATPEDLFYDGLLASQDRFSFIVDDYIELENLFSGISTTTGMSYGLVRFSSDSNDIFGYVRYVQPNTSASEAGVKRGNIFTQIDDQQLTVSNYQDLLNQTSYTLGFATITDNTISENGETATLMQREYNANPIFIAKTLDVNGQKVGYLMYNSFVADYDPELNAAFAKFKADGVTDLVLDLRYDGGGSVRTATDLSAMITGQFPGEIFTKEQWNKDYQEYFESTDPERLLNKFNTKITNGEMINSLNLSRLFVLTTDRTASASELVINGLKPYINVVQIGETTTGKFQASVTLYDSPDFGRLKANSKHTYAIQPLVLKSANKNGVSDYVNGLDPDIQISEDITNLGVLGDPNEPFLKAALDAIKGNKKSISRDFKLFDPVAESNMNEMNYQRMYIDELPGTISQ